MKKLLMIPLLSLILFNSSSSLYSGDQPKKYTGIAWDLHDVILQRNWGEFFHALALDLTTMRLLLSPAYFEKNKKILPLVYQYWKERKPIDQYIAAAEELNYQELVDHLKKFCTCWTVDQATAKFIENHPEISHYIASNIGPVALQALIEKNKEFSKLYAQLSKPDTIVDYKKHQKDKPNQEFFDRLIDNVTQEQRKLGNYGPITLLFIDDKEKNITGAMAHETDGIKDIDGIIFNGPGDLKKIEEKITS